MLMMTMKLLLQTSKVLTQNLAHQTVVILTTLVLALTRVQVIQIAQTLKTTLLQVKSLVQQAQAATLQLITTIQILTLHQLQVMIV